MTREERLALYWSLLEGDLQNKFTAANARISTAKRLAREANPDSKFPSMPSSTKEIAWEGEAGAYASVLDLVHTAMRELGLHYPTER